MRRWKECEDNFLCQLDKDFKSKWCATWQHHAKFKKLRQYYISKSCSLIGRQLILTIVTIDPNQYQICIVDNCVSFPWTKKLSSTSVMRIIWRFIHTEVISYIQFSECLICIIKLWIHECYKLTIICACQKVALNIIVPYYVYWKKYSIFIHYYISVALDIGSCKTEERTWMQMYRFYITHH